MKLAKIGLIATAAVVLLSPAIASAQGARIDARAQKRGMTEAPAVVAASGTVCTVSDALFLLSGTDAKTKTKTDAYEVACSEGMGRVVLKAVTGDQTKYSVYDCLTTSQPYADGKPNQLACKLPANQNPMAGLAPFITKAGLTCDVKQTRPIGQTPENSFFELACADSRGFLLGVPVSLDPAKESTASNCLAFEDNSPMACKLTTREAQLASVTTLAAAADAACQVKDRRYILSTRAGDEYYEVACASGVGFVAVADPKGAFKQKIDCANADSIQGGCTLTDTRTAKTDDNPLYTRLAKAAGFNCDVSGYRFLTADASGETVELACTNRPDGAIALLPKSGTGGRFYNCAAAQTTGYRCGLTKPEAANAQLTAAVKRARPTSTCAVSESKFLGMTPDAGFVEVACADREPGYVLRYPKTSDVASDAFYCTQSRSILNVSCSLPTNLPRG
jgi:hypothetical protein